MAIEKKESNQSQLFLQAQKIKKIKLINSKKGMVKLNIERNGSCFTSK